MQEEARGEWNLAVARAQDLAVPLFVGVAAVVQPFAIDEYMLDSARRHDQAPAAARQVVAHLAAFVGTDRIVVKSHDISRHSGQ